MKSFGFTLGMDSLHCGARCASLDMTVHGSEALAIPEEIIAEIRSRLSFVDLASESLELRRSGSKFVACCPFHKEKTPSFFVDEEKARFHCFGCGKNGSVFDFVMEQRGFSFPEAVRFLGGRVGVDVPDASRVSSENREKRIRHESLLRHILGAAAKAYRRELLEGARSRMARDYLSGRGISPDLAESFGLGLAPKGWRFIEERVLGILSPELAKRDGLRSALLEVGLLRRSNRDSADAQLDRASPAKERASGDSAGSSVEAQAHVYDSFRERLIFPIRRSDGACIAFGGRTLREDSGAPKYMNSCESPVYAKRRAFFGIDKALAAMRKRHHTYLVEGYMDVMALVGAGFRETVATCGTAVTPEHVDTLRRFVRRATVVFDGDAPGRKAAAACFEIFINSGIELSALILPDGEDPDSLCRKDSGKLFRKLLDESKLPAVDAFISYRLEELGSEGEAFGPVSAGKVATEFSRVVAKVGNPVEREFMLKRGCELLGVSMSSLSSLVDEQGRKAKRRASFSRESGSPRRILAPAEPRRKTPHIAAEGPKRKETEKGEDRLKPLSAYYERLLVSLLCEPALAEHLLEMPHVLEPPWEAELWKNRVRELVSEIAESSEEEVAERETDEDGERAASVPQFAVELLLKHEFDAYRLVGEARRQLRVGGADPRGLIERIAAEIPKKKLQIEVDELREREAKETNGEIRKQLAQDKLLKRRKMEAAERAG